MATVCNAAKSAMGLPCSQQLWSIERAVVFLTIHTIRFTLTFAEFFLLLVSFFYAWFSVGVVGLVWVVYRQVFLSSIPLLIDLAVPLTLFVDAIIVSFDTLENVVAVLYDAANAIASAFGDGGTYMKFTKITVLSVDQVTDELKLIALQCTPIDSVTAIADQWMPRLLDDAMCPLFRATWPLPHGIGETLYHPFRGWVSDPTPYPGNNCDPPPVVSHGILCAALAVGYGVVEVVLPSVFVGIFLMSSGGELASVLWGIASVCVACLSVVACWLSRVVTALRTTVRCACAVATGD